jgi:enoyl-CoA hydratase
MTGTQVQLKIDGSHAAIVFRTETGLNVLTDDLLHTLGAIVARLRKENHVRTASIQGDGKVFMAGADIKEMAAFNPDQARGYAELGQGVFADLAALPCITVAAIQGAAMGGGMELALACDFRIAVKSAKLGMPEVTLGLIPGWGGITRLNKLLGTARAKRLFLSGNPISGEEALAWGLVDDVVNSPEDLPHKVQAFCKSYKRASPTAVALAKRATRDLDELSAFAECFNHRDSREGMRAFIEKRPASWME